jgi:hypothetical protein
MIVFRLEQYDEDRIMTIIFPNLSLTILIFKKCKKKKKHYFEDFSKVTFLLNLLFLMMVDWRWTPLLQGSEISN